MVRSSDIHIFIADRDSVVCQSIADVLHVHDFKTQTFLSAKDLLNYCQSKFPNCVILDSDLPDADALDVLHHLRLHNERLPVFLTSARGDVPMAVEAIKRGATDFLEKPFKPNTLLEKLNKALDADPPQAAQPDQVDFVKFEQEITSLPLRQKQILKRLVLGQQNKKIAFNLSISKRTVETHRARMMKRLGVHSLAELVSLVVRSNSKRNQN